MSATKTPRPILRHVNVINIHGLSDDEIMALAEKMQANGVSDDTLVIFTTNSTLRASVRDDEKGGTILRVEVDATEEFDEFACLMNSLLAVQEHHDNLSLEIENLSDKIIDLPNDPKLATMPLDVALQIMEEQHAQEAAISGEHE